MVIQLSFGGFRADGSISQPYYNLVLVAAMGRGTSEQKTVADSALLWLASEDAHVSAALTTKLEGVTSKDTEEASGNNGVVAVCVS